MLVHSISHQNMPNNDLVRITVYWYTVVYVTTISVQNGNVSNTGTCLEAVKQLNEVQMICIPHPPKIQTIKQYIIFRMTYHKLLHSCMLAPSFVQYTCKLYMYFIYRNWYLLLICTFGNKLQGTFLKY